MAAASTVKGGEPSESGSPGQTNVPLNLEENQDSGKNSSLVEKQGGLGDNGASHKEKNDKADQAAKKFVDAPLPVTNPWTRRSTSLTSAAETSHVPSNTEVKKEISNDKNSMQVNASVHKPSRMGKGSVSDPEGTKSEKPKPEKPKADLNGSKQADINLKPKIKMFGEDYVEAPLPTVNPWKKPSATIIAGASAGATAGPFRGELDPTPAAAAAAVVSPGPFIQDVQSNGPIITPEPKREAKPQESAPEEPTPNKGASPALADDNWPTLHEVKVTEPNQVMPPKPTKSPKVKVVPSPIPAEPSPVPEPAPEVSTVEIEPTTDGDDSTKLTEIAQAVVQNDLGGDDSSKENKESSLNGDDTNNAVKNKKGTKPKWQRMEIEHPKPDRRNRRSRSQGRGTSPARRDGRPAGDRFHRPNSRKSDAGPDSQDWRANMISQATTATSPTTDSSRNGTGGSFVGTRGFRGRGGIRGAGLRRGGGRGRGGARDTKSPPFQSTNHNSWNNEPFPVNPADSETVPVPWSQGFNRVQTIPRVPPINPVMLGLDTNLFIQEQLLNILGQSNVFYESAPPTYAPETLKHQVEYYFSEDNLVKDLFLRKKMDKQGWVKLELVLSFNKVKELKADYGSLIQAIRCSDKLELSQHEDFVRTLNTPDVWPIEEDLKGLPPPPAVQRVAAMSTLHSDAPEFVPGKPFVLRSLTSDAPEFVPAAKSDEATTHPDNQRPDTDEDEDNLLCHATSNLTTIPHMLSSR